MQIIEWRQERALLVKEAKALIDKVEVEKRGFTDAEDNAYIKYIRDIDRLSERIEQEDGTREPRASERGLQGVWDYLNKDDNGGAAAAGGAFEGRTSSDDKGVYLPGQSIYETRSRNREYFLPDGIRAEELDMGRFVRGLVTGNWKDAQAEYRAMSVASDVLGGYAVPEPLSDKIIDLARNYTAVTRAGARTVNMTSSTMAFPRVTKAPAGMWKPENEHGSFEDMELGRTDLRARTLWAATKMSEELIQDAEGLGHVVMDALAAALALKLDYAALRGSGIGEEPAGIKTWYEKGLGVQHINLGDDGGLLRGYNTFGAAWQLILQENGPERGISVITSPRETGTIDRLVDNVGNPAQAPKSWEMMNQFSTNQIPTNLVKGTSDPVCSEAYVGNFSQLYIGLRDPLRLEISKQAADGSGGSAFSQYQIWMRATQRCDLALIRPSWFVFIDGIKQEPVVHPEVEG